jgi:hypothetical protein
MQAIQEQEDMGDLGIDVPTGLAVGATPLREAAQRGAVAIQFG